MNEQTKYNSKIINGIAFGFSLAFLISSFIAARYTGEWGQVFHNWKQIMTSPGPLVTDYLEAGGLASAMLNAGACGMACVLFMVGLKGESHANTLSGYFLVVAHCFYGLNFLNMWPCFLGPFLYLEYKKLDFKRNLHVCMFATSFSPFVSELLFRYTQGEDFVQGTATLTLAGVTLTFLFAILLGYVVPAILPGAKAWHKGYNLYNGGLAFGLFGFFLYQLLYKTLGVTAPVTLTWENPIYDSFGRSYQLYANCFFITVFLLCIVIGYFLNGKSFHGFHHLVKDTGFSSDFASAFGMPLCLINIGCLGSFFLLYLNLIILLTPGAGFTGPTIGVMVAALTFTAMGQHPRNIWPILVGYLLLYLSALFFNYMNGWNLSWSISTQGYINAAAFATGLCPIVGRYGVRAGILAGFMCASMCTGTSALHGGLVLYNGGFTTGITALILLPILEHYFPAREEIRRQGIHMQDMITLIETISTPDEQGEQRRKNNRWHHYTT